MSQQPWASGPGEILQHGLSLLGKDSDKNRRLALLSIDNAVELTLKTYLSLPRRVTGINMSRKDFLEISESFPRLLDALEQHAADKLNGINLGEIEWFHRLRNELYHQGNGLTVERDKVEVYAELAKLLFRNLFGVEVEIGQHEEREVLGKFLAAWVRLEKAIGDISLKYQDKMSTLGGKTLPPLLAIRELVSIGVLDHQTARDIEPLRQIRNQVAHGSSEYINMLTPEIVRKVNALSDKLENTS